MLKRIISAILALIIFIPILVIGDLPFYGFAFIISIIGFLELGLLITKNKLAITSSLFTYIYIIASNITKTDFVFNLSDIGIIFILNLIIKLICYKDKTYNIKDTFSLIFLTIFLSFSFLNITIIRNISLYYFIYLFLITTLNDTFALFGGMLFGKHKIVSISPKKTYEGAIIGILVSTILSTLFYVSFINSNNIIITILITLFLNVISPCGDMFFSYIKRNFNIKDFSNIMPGHGGVLDRCDSIIFTSLIFTFFINYI